ncbi:MAG: hypothetical protein HY553_08475 [Elusimicrobia bacterium]|nr:hypothetical protein [Elusimicrobiota bacterium]
MADIRRVAAVVRRHGDRVGEARLRRRLLSASLTPDTIDAAFRFARFLAVRGEAPPPARRRAQTAAATAGAVAWAFAIATATTLRLWSGGSARPAEAMPELLRVRDAISAYRPPPLSPPLLLDAYLEPRPAGNACEDYLEAAEHARAGAFRLLRGRDAPKLSGLARLERGTFKEGCAILGVLRLPESEDEWASLQLDVAVIESLAHGLRRRAEERLRLGRYDLAEEDARRSLSVGRHLLEDWLPESQAAGRRLVQSGLGALSQALAGRGVLDAESRVLLGRMEAETRAYAADPAELRVIADTSRAPEALERLTPFLEAGAARAYAQAALEGAALGWSRAEVEAARPDPRRLRWLTQAAGRGDPRLEALAWGAARRLARAERACRGMSPERRRAACPTITD